MYPPPEVQLLDQLVGMRNRCMWGSSLRLNLCQ